ncbi:gamma-aminobutyric acid type B receptor subunit 2 [Trichonephila inaurata madagascariensis]|uniref:Gamma-aminobutyric acid type B receptor subunit 2 n=1 Tax=Trichonephila inaurata madagascariensis TaxID=2747483 RepID=A0A8X6J708_9ARAC|nr:gamma-aminobutyric acid type B receptor subunit 2 [Trichonephila inaurata madagascariensis]
MTTILGTGSSEVTERLARVVSRWNIVQPMTKLNTDLEQMNVTVAVTKGVSERDYKDQVQEIKNQDCRIIICSFSYSLFKKIFCEVMGFFFLLAGVELLNWRDGSDEPENQKTHNLERM